jgi:hypothetical protein
MQRCGAAQLYCWFDTMFWGIYRSEVASKEMIRCAYRRKEIPNAFLIQQFTVHAVTQATYRKSSVSGICGELEKELGFQSRLVGTRA